MIDDEDVPEADLVIAHLSQCECGCPVLIREPDPKRGDTFKCPECNTVNQVGSIYSNIRKEKSPQDLEVIHLPFLD